MSEQREILRRIAERGLRLARKGAFSDLPDGTELSEREAVSAGAHEQHLDLWQHMLDEIARLPETEGSNSGG